jgi:CRISPR/Cas system-associated exonuclease Cas4 (RecB family)
MPLPDDFQFTQSNLQDYTDCPRRFQLRYLMQLAWPAIAVEPADEYEAQVQDGETFHRLAQQHVLGILPWEDQPRLDDEPLAEWWRAYLADPPADLPLIRLPEITLSAPLGDHRLTAKYDLIALDPGRRAVIVDWKTSAKRPRPGWLIGRLQTRVYRYLLVRAGGDLRHVPGTSQVPGTSGGGPSGATLAPDQVEMIYWFANFPDAPERLPYDATQFAADGRVLTELAAEITQRADPVFPLTDDLKRCGFCAYRSLCGRGVVAGDMSDAGDDAAAVEEPAAGDWAEGFDFEQVGEIAF